MKLILDSCEDCTVKFRRRNKREPSLVYKPWNLIEEGVAPKTACLSLRMWWAPKTTFPDLRKWWTPKLKGRLTGCTCQLYDVLYINSWGEIYTFPSLRFGEEVITERLGWSLYADRLIEDWVQCLRTDVILDILVDLVSRSANLVQWYQELWAWITRPASYVLKCCNRT